MKRRETARQPSKYSKEPKQQRRNLVSTLGYEISEPFCWDASFKTWYNKIDDEHKTLFNAIFNLARDYNQDNMNELERVTGKHFKEEEEMMQATQYVGFADHKKAHDDFIAVLHYGNIDINYAKNWLVNHIKGTDFKYKSLL